MVFHTNFFDLREYIISIFHYLCSVFSTMDKENIK